jgi:anti-sigma factor RsiW
MTCRELVDFVLDYESGLLSVEERATFEDHLVRCPCCRVYLDTYRRTIQLGKLAHANDPAAIEPIPDELVRAILASARGKRA